MSHFILVGLGNPGEQYEQTRHNVGFVFIDKIATDFDFPDFSSKFSSLVSSKIIGPNKITLIKPQTFMNLSGQAIAKVLQFYKLNSNDVIVVHDDLDLQLAKVKMKLGGGSGGHNGLKSIDQHIGANYYRLRIGIGKPIHKGDVSNFVLNKFSKEETKLVEDLLAKLTNNLDLILAKDASNLMNKISC